MTRKRAAEPPKGEFEEQWEAVAAYDVEIAKTYGDLSSCKRERFPWPDRCGVPVNTRELPPIHALFDFWARGQYPPPALLLHLHAQFESYLSAGGSKSLDDIFLGKGKKKAGSYAKQWATRLRNIDLMLRFDDPSLEGFSDSAKAEHVAEQVGLEPITLQRIVRKTGAGKKKVTK